jgi:hypothetical protein
VKNVPRKCQSRVTRLDLKTKNGSLRLDDIGQSFMAAIRPLRCIRELRALPANEAEAKVQLGRLLRTPRTGTHPLRHLVLIQWLFGDWATFWRAYHNGGTVVAETKTIETPPTTQPERLKTSDQVAELLHLLADGGQSISGAARQLGIDPTTAMAWAAKEGISTPRRAKLLLPEIRSGLIAGLRQGRQKEALAKRYGISIQTVTRTLRTEVGLQDDWSQARFARSKAVARLRWGRIAQKYGGSGVKTMRNLAPDTFAWQYRNDRTWLVECNQQFAMDVPRSNNSRVNWDQRDVALSSQVKRIALEWFENSPGISVTRERSLAQRAQLST